ncbi:hypothetical protein EQG49_00195 [Periweissella cryptocerci]|uniref:Uncharacterized protein n=1 Tax=Periweissella cryptocerci TaxID=2506420 RepID=A0A4P6YQV3_9LACO|nr:hypothetical protein [Periweissella cryptocerci]QBO34974.1 hypothetical protein EQG49_00195 [Periweissella cryptocerci]
MFTRNKTSEFMNDSLFLKLAYPKNKEEKNTILELGQEIEGFSDGLPYVSLGNAERLFEQLRHLATQTNLVFTFGIELYQLDNKNKPESTNLAIQPFVVDLNFVNIAHSYVDDFFNNKENRDNDDLTYGDISSYSNDVIKAVLANTKIPHAMLPQIPSEAEYFTAVQKQTPIKIQSQGVSVKKDIDTMQQSESYRQPEEVHSGIPVVTSNEPSIEVGEDVSNHSGEYQPAQGNSVRADVERVKSPEHTKHVSSQPVLLNQYQVQPQLFDIDDTLVQVEPASPDYVAYRVNEAHKNANKYIQKVVDELNHKMDAVQNEQFANIQAAVANTVNEIESDYSYRDVTHKQVVDGLLALQREELRAEILELDDAHEQAQADAKREYESNLELLASKRKNDEMNLRTVSAAKYKNLAADKYAEIIEPLDQDHMKKVERLERDERKERTLRVQANLNKEVAKNEHLLAQIFNDMASTIDSDANAWLIEQDNAIQHQAVLENTKQAGSNVEELRQQVATRDRELAENNRQASILETTITELEKQNTSLQMQVQSFANVAQQVPQPTSQSEKPSKLEQLIEKQTELAMLKQITNDESSKHKQPTQQNTQSWKPMAMVGSALGVLMIVGISGTLLFSNSQRSAMSKSYDTRIEQLQKDQSATASSYSKQLEKNSPSKEASSKEVTKQTDNTDGDATFMQPSMPPKTSTAQSSSNDSFSKLDDAITSKDGYSITKIYEDSFANKDLVTDDRTYAIGANFLKIDDLASAKNVLATNKGHNTRLAYAIADYEDQSSAKVNS